MASFQSVHVYAYDDSGNADDLGAFTTAAMEGDDLVVFPGKRTLLRREPVTRGEETTILWRLFDKSGQQRAKRFRWFEVTAFVAS